MKCSKTFLFMATVVIFLTGCTSTQSDVLLPTKTNLSQPEQLISSPTPMMTEVTPSENSLTWETGIKDIFVEQCLECHGTTPTGGLSVASYSRIMQGSNIGKIILPGNPKESHVFIKLKYSGNHPGYMTKEQTEIVWEWVSNGAPE